MHDHPGSWSGECAQCWRDWDGVSTGDTDDAEVAITNLHRGGRVSPLSSRVVRIGGAHERGCRCRECARRQRIPWSIPWVRVWWCAYWATALYLVHFHS